MSSIEEVKSRIITAKEFANLVGTSDRTVQLLAKRGVLETKKKNPYRFEIGTALLNYVQYLKSISKEQDDPEDDAKNKSRKLKADADLAEAKAKKEELKLKELEGVMHHSEDVKAMTEDLIYSIRGSITALPGKLAMNVAGEDDPNVCSQLIQNEVIQLLQGLSEYEYSKERYRRRMKERLKNDDQTDEEDD